MNSPIYPAIRHRASPDPRLLACILPAALGLLFFLSIPIPYSGIHLTILGIAVTIGSGLFFLLDGGAYITPFGVYSLATTVFQGLAAILLARAGLEASTNALIKATLFSGSLYFLAAATYVFMSKRSRWNTTARARAGTQSYDNPALRRQVNLLAAVVFIAGIATGREPSLATLSNSLQYAGIALFCAACLLLSPQVPVISAHWLQLWKYPLIAYLVFATQTFNGLGRLTLVGLGMTIAFSITAVRPRRSYKVVLLIMIAPALAFGSAVQLATEGDVVVALDSNNGRGLGSALSPLDTLALLVSGEGPDAEKLTDQFGATFLKTSVAWVPRSVWSNKPLGYGAELASVYHPEAFRSAGHSDVALLSGEWYTNFDYWSVAIAPLTVALVFALLDRWVRELLELRTPTRRAVFELAAFLSIVSSLAELVWGGTFSWMARGGLACLSCLALYHAQRVHLTLSRLRHPRANYTSNSPI